MDGTDGMQGRDGSTRSAANRLPGASRVALLGLLCARAALAQAVIPDDVPATGGPPPPSATPVPGPTPLPPPAAQTPSEEDDDDLPTRESVPAPVRPAPPVGSVDPPPLYPPQIFAVPDGPAYAPQAGDSEHPSSPSRSAARRWSLFTVGMTLSVTTYLAGAVFGAYLAEQGWWAMPLVGPFVWAAREREGGAFIGAFFGGGVQAAGLILLAVGAWKATRPERPAPSVKLTLTPSLAPGFSGLSAIGTF